jgi:hypothetical protein
MSVEGWADITEAGASTDGERGRGGERATRTERATQHLVRPLAAASHRGGCVL